MLALPSHISAMAQFTSCNLPRADNGQLAALKRLPILALVAIKYFK
jgi:hypothetical protein